MTKTIRTAFKVLVLLFFLISCRDSKQVINRRRGFLTGLHVRFAKIGIMQAQTGFDNEEVTDVRVVVNNINSATFINLQQAKFVYIMKRLGFEKITVISRKTLEKFVLKIN